ncbi:MAG: plasmid recombination protein [Clostridiales bacterium]|nr:plasmid recombination protein [Candidatus Crickella caballi]
MTENYSIIRIEKHKLGEVTPICNHHERLKERYKSNPDIDTDRSHLNFHIVEPSDKYRPLVLARIKEAGAKMRKDSVVMQDCIVAATPEWIMALSDEAQAEYFRYAFEFFEKRYRRENIISAVVHMDEKTPHMHLVFVPITEDNRLSSKEIIGGPKGMHQLQDDFYEHMEAKYPDLMRGKPKQITHRKHIPTYLFKQTAALYEHYNEILAAVNNIGLMNNSQKKDEAIALLGMYAPEMAHLKDQLKITERYIAKQGEQIDELEERVKSKNRVISNKDNVIDEKDQKIGELRDEVRELNLKQKKLMKVIERIPRDVLEKMAAEEKQRRRNDRER